MGEEFIRIAYYSSALLMGTLSVNLVRIQSCLEGNSMRWFLITYVSKSWDEDFPSTKKILESGKDLEEAYKCFLEEMEKRSVSFQVLAVSDVTGIEHYL